MRPETLELKNFGPFYGEHRADFAALGNFFLICGETGAGKTTLFDAISYAFYGEAPGSRKGLAKQLRSQYADDSEESFVQLTFSIGSSRWRIRRTLPSERESARTKKIMTVPEEVSLEKMAGGIWAAETPGGKKETDNKILSLVKLSADEFSRIVLLPQGEFSNFLKQNSEERKEILSKLFPVSIYSDAAEKIKENAKTAVNAAVDAKNRKDALSATFNAETFDEDKKRMKEKLAALRKEGEALHEKILKQSELLNTAQRIREKQGRLKEAEGAYRKEIIACKEDFSGWQQKLDAGSRAAPVAGFIREYQTACKDLSMARANYAEKCSLFEQTQKELALLEADREKAESADGEIASLVKRKTLIEGTVDAATEYEKSAKEIKALESLIETKKDEQGALTDNIAQAEVSIKEKESECSTDILMRLTQEKVATERDCELAVDKAARTAKYLKDKKQHEELQSKYESTKKDISEKVANLKNAESALENARAALKATENQQMAAALASSLEEGSPCPVCGSVHHPAPAKKSEQGLEVLDLAVKAAEQKKAEADSALQAAKEASAKLEGELKTLSFQIENLEKEGSVFADNEEAEKALAAAKAKSTETAQALERANRVLDEATALKEKRDGLRRQLEENDRGLQDAERNLAVYKERNDAALARFNEVFPNLKPERAAAEKALIDCEKEKNSLEQFLKGFREKSEKLRSEKDSLEGSEKELKASVENLEKKSSDAEQKLKQEYLAAGFKSYEEAKMAVLTLDEKNKLFEQIESFKSRKVELEKQISLLKQELNAETAGVPADLDEAKLKAEYDALNRSAEDNQERREKAVSQLNAIEENRKRWEELEEECAKKQEEADVFSRLSSDLQGKNPRNVKFESWILSQYLEEITRYANIRISRMSNDRYRLRCGGNFRRGNAMTGLDLEIFDSHTGKTRPTGTLSGGETFMASISLALGLADSIQARSGGIQLEAVFIDEGFGSLDEESLELAMDILDEIRGHRMVGIISHVRELRERIPEKLEVKKKPSGGSYINIKR